MADPFIGDIKLCAWQRVPIGWLPCDGALLPISEYNALFALIGTIYGGDGQVTFGLPDLRGRVPVHAGNGFAQGQKGGAEEVALTAAQMPSHAHVLTASNSPATSPNPEGRILAESPTTTPYLANAPFPSTVALSPQSLSPAGGNQPHPNMQPFTSVQYFIAYEGLFPTRS